MNLNISKLKRNIYIYVVCNLAICILFMALLVNLLCIGDLGVFTIVIVALLIAMLVGLAYFLKKYIEYNRKEAFLKANGLCIKASIDTNELKIGGDNIKHICYLVAYYTPDETTYIFKDAILIFDTQFIFDIETIKEKGIVPPKIDILVDPNDYNRYVVLKYNYLYEIYQANSELVDFYI